LTALLTAMLEEAESKKKEEVRIEFWVGDY
jgi:hypothetical protein